MVSPYFDRRVRVEWLSDGRSVQLLEPLIFMGPDGKTWKAPTGAIVDGASIPWLLWRAIGSPFVGKYRRASVIHDYYCATRSRTSRDVHRVFYDAMIADGTPRLKAWLMWAAVRVFGPRFDVKYK